MKRRVRSGMTLTEVLVVIIITSVFFGAAVLIFSNLVELYQTSRAHLRLLYAESHVSILYDIMENELKYAGSGAALLKNLHHPSGGRYSELADRTWLFDCVDYDPQTKTLFISYVITYPVVLVRKESTGGSVTYFALNSGYLGQSKWIISKNTLSPSAPGYVTRYLSLQDITPVATTTDYPGYVNAGEAFSLTSALTSEDRYVYLIAKYKDATFGFSSDEASENDYTLGSYTGSFRQIQLTYDQTRRKVTMKRLIPTLPSDYQLLSVDLLSDVSEFKVFLLYMEDNEVREIEFGEAKQMTNFNRERVFAIKVYLECELDWLHGKKHKVIKSRVFTFVTSL